MIKTIKNKQSTLLREVSTWSVEDVSDYVFYLVYIWGIPIHYKYIVYLLKQCLSNKSTNNCNNITNNSTKTSNSVNLRNQKQKLSDNEEEDVAIIEVIDETQSKDVELTNNVNSSDDRMQRWSDCVSCTSSLEEIEQFVRTDLFNSIVERGEEANNKISKCKSLIKHCHNNNNNNSSVVGEFTHSHIVLLSLVSNCCEEQNVTMSEVNTSIGFNVKIMENKCASSKNEKVQACKAEVIALHSTFLESTDIIVNNWAEATYWTAVADVYNLEKEQTSESHSIDLFITLPRLKFNQTSEKNVKPKGKNTKRDRKGINNTKQQNNNKRVATDIHKNNKNTLNLFSRAQSNYHHPSTTLPVLSPITLITQGDSQNSTMNNVHIIIEEEEGKSASYTNQVNDSSDVIVISDDDDDNSSHHEEQMLQSAKHLSVNIQ